MFIRSKTASNIGLLVLVRSLRDFRFNFKTMPQRNVYYFVIDQKKKCILFGCQLKQHFSISMGCSSDEYQLEGCGYLMFLVDIMFSFSYMDYYVIFFIKICILFFAYKNKIN